ncbi:IclR family transcriptional regulator [Microbacterium sp. 18062]|uniref:IclR family transcriptional regulator n=1 Tax=Microbacterium sp. 18062 TaxID=2681410 RepID=UPI00190F84E2|nr:IclR family transcriptional regulator [Microbacterium sp. 18062]
MSVEDTDVEGGGVGGAAPGAVPAGEPARRDSTSTVGRALGIIATFREGRATQSLSEMSRHADLPLTTTHRIVVELLAWGALERTSHGRYRIGLRLWEVASLAPRSVALQAVARPYMHDLYEITHYSVHLAVRESFDAVFVECFRSPDETSSRPRIGSRYALHATAVGQVLLAHAPDDVREEVLSGELRPFTSNTYSSRAELQPALDEIARQGYAISDRQIRPELVSVAAPIAQPSGSVVGALSLILPYERADGTHMVHLVRSTARAISRALGRQHLTLDED